MPELICTLRLKVRPEAYRWLNTAAVEVNQVFNYANEISYTTATRTDRKRKWLSGFDLCTLTAGATEYFQRIGARSECLPLRGGTRASILDKICYRE
jgi:hypothetical protein